MHLVTINNNRPVEEFFLRVLKYVKSNSKFL